MTLSNRDNKENQELQVIPFNWFLYLNQYKFNDFEKV